MDAFVLEDLLRDAFPTADIVVDGADGVHMSAQVIAEEFKGKNRVAQQRMVYAALKGKMDGPNGELHALALTTKVKE
jgi:acid stress-induced BolA-like protein IbaG/YrbA